MADTRLLEFEARIAEGHKIEAHDWMPDRYRALLTKMIGFHALGEVAAFPIVQGLALSAPTLKRKLIANAFIQDELGHGQSVLRVWQGLGEDLHTLLSRFESGELRLMNVLLKRFNGWSDFVVFGMLIDSLEVDRLGSLTDCSYGPYARSLVKIVAEEGFHFRQSADAVKTAMTQGTEQQREAVQESMNRWWPEVILAYGPPERDDESDRPVVRWRVKVRGNEELRQKFLQRTVPLLTEWGVSIPDPKLRFDTESKTWDYTQPDWEHFGSIPEDRKEFTDIYKNYLRYAVKHIDRDQPILPGRLWDALYGTRSRLPGSIPLTELLVS